MRGMAKVGNHGKIIPRDKKWLTRLYWIDELTTPMIADLCGTNHKSVLNVFVKLGIPRRGKGVPSVHGLCIDCGICRPKKLKHKLTKSGETGTRCAECLKKYKRAHFLKSLASGTKNRTQEQVREKRKADLRRWYIEGPKHPKGESQWIRKAKHLLRTNRRILAGMTNPNRSQSRNVVSERGQTSQM